MQKARQSLGGGWGYVLRVTLNLAVDRSKVNNSLYNSAQYGTSACTQNQQEVLRYTINYDWKTSPSVTGWG